MYKNKCNTHSQCYENSKIQCAKQIWGDNLRQFWTCHKQPATDDAAVLTHNECVTFTSSFEKQHQQHACLLRTTQPTCTHTHRQGHAH